MRRIDVKVEIFYSEYQKGPVYDGWHAVELEDAELYRLVIAGKQTDDVEDIYEEISDQLEYEINELVTTNDGLWYYDFTEAFSEDEPFSIRDTENTGYSMRIVIDFDYLKQLMMEADSH